MYIRVMLGLMAVLLVVIAIEMAYARKPVPVSAAPAIEEAEGSAGLDCRLAEVSLDHVPLDQALKRVAAQAHANLVMNDWDWRNARSPLNGRPVTLRLKNVPLRAALTAVIRSSGSDNMVFASLGGEVIEMSWGGMPKRPQIHVYGVRDVVPHPKASRLPVPNPHIQEMLGRDPFERAPDSDVIAAVIAKLPADDELRLVAALRDLPGLEQFSDNFGVPVPCLIPGLLIANASPDQARTLQQVLAEMRHPIGPNSQTASLNSASEALRRRVPILRIEKLSPDRAIDALRAAFHANILVIADTFDTSADPTVSIDLRDVSLGEALVEVLKPFQTDPNDFSPTFCEDDEFIIVGFAGSIPRTVHVYDVNDIVNYNPAATRNAQNHHSTSRTDELARADKVIGILHSQLDNNPTESKAEDYRYWNGRLLVRQHWPAHLKVQAILHRLRAGPSSQTKKSPGG